MGLPPEKYGFSPEEYGEKLIWLHSWRFCSKLKLLLQESICTAPKEILKFYNLPMKNSMGPQPGRGVGVQVF